MKKTVLLSVLLVSFSMGTIAKAAGMISPGYQSLSKLDAAIATLAQGSSKNNLARKQPGDVTVHSANMTKNKSTNADVISIDVGNNICTLGITEHLPPKGISGAPSYTASLALCSRYLTAKAVDVMKYEDARKTLEKAAAKNMTNLSFTVIPSPQGLVVKLNNK